MTGVGATSDVALLSVSATIVVDRDCACLKCVGVTGVVASVDAGPAA